MKHLVLLFDLIVSLRPKFQPMNKTKETLVTAFALFSLFFGAGNLILPPLLGFKSGDFWWLVTLGFCISAICIPIMGIFAHARLQGTLYDFGKKVSPKFALVFALLIYAIAAGLPSPRTASVTHEIAIQPYFDTPYILTSIIYFALVFVFVMNRSKILDILGKFLTPAIIFILLLIIGITTFSYPMDFGDTVFPNPFTAGVLEGYQTFDAIGAVVVGGVIIVSINLKNKGDSFKEKRALVRRAGWIAGFALLLIYAGLIFTGALMHQEFDADVSRTAILNGISLKTLGNKANLFLGILVSLACFTTAVGIVTGTADFIKSRFGDSQMAYTITAIIGCVLGVGMGQFNVDYIIDVALPTLMFIYPITIILIILNVLPEKYTSPMVFKTVVITTFLFSIPDFMGSIGLGDTISAVKDLIPLSDYSMGWVIPAFAVFIGVNVIKK